MPSLQVVLQRLYPTPPYILTLVTWVQRTQAWLSANSARRLACGQTESYSVQPRILDGRARLYSSELSYIYCIGICTKKKTMNGKK